MEHNKRLLHKPLLSYPKQTSSLCLFLIIFLLGFVSSVLAQPVSKEEVLAKYEQVLQLAEELNIYQHDILQIVPKIHDAAKALLRNEFGEADRLLTEALFELSLIEERKPTQLQQALRLEWLEIYREIIQKFALLAILAYLLVSFPYYRRMLRADHLSPVARMYLCILTGSSAIFFSLFDLASYGETAWAFLDIQVVLLAVGGLLGGVWPGLFAGVIVGIFRMVFRPNIIYFAIAIVTGLIGGLFSTKIRTYKSMEKISFGAGALVGAVHGIGVFLPMFFLLPWLYVVMSIGFLCFFEASAVLVFMMVITGILGEDKRRETERELLQSEFRFLQAQISPHFLYNSLNTIAAVCAREGSHQGRNLVLRLGAFLRGTLKRAEDLVTLEEEIAYLDSYLELEKARFQDRLRIENEFGDLRKEVWEFKIPFLLLQPLVENAIKHGIAKKEQGGTIRIRLHEKDDILYVDVIDDGIGTTRNPLVTDSGLMEDPNRTKGTGIGLQNINKRMIQMFGPEYELRFSSEPGKGTRVTVKIPLTLADKKRKWGKTGRRV